MSDASFELPSVDAVTVGTVGPAGQRVFYLQARAGGTLVTVKVEKQQVAALAVALRALLAELPPAADSPSAPELEEPVEPAWVTGTMGLGPFDEATRRVTLLLQEMVPEEDMDSSASTAHLGLTVGQMAALAARADEVVGQGRPPCPLCGSPIDPSGHSCPKTNGHLKR